MSCTNCYNNCTDIKSDKCIKYTGVDVPLLGILNGDSLSVVEQALITFLSSTLDGTGIKLTIDPIIICETVSQYITECEDLTLVNILNALINAICEIKTITESIQTSIDAIEADYSPACLDVAPTAGTHVFLQAVITKLCANETILTALIANLPSTYVRLTNLDTLIQTYLNSIGTSTNVYNKMIPYVAVEYYGSLSYFDATGAGTGLWEKIYLCNGDNGTPDKRGRVGVGCTNMLGSVPLSVVVDPAVIGNPTYSLTSPGVSTKTGANVITLTNTQLPAHTHTATSVVTESTHFHYELVNEAGTATDANIDAATYPDRAGGLGGTTSYELKGSATFPTVGKSSSDKTNLTVATTIANDGGGDSHSNIQPVIATNYIIYLP